MTRTLTTAFSLKHLTVGLMLACIACAGLYAFFIGQTVFNVAERHTLSNSLGTLRSDVGSLELEYVSLTGDITRDHAYELGFSSPVSVSYVSRSSFALAGEGGEE